MKRQSNRRMLRKEGDETGPVPMRSGVSAWVALAFLCWPASAAEVPGASQFRKDIQPILTEFCFDCHADGANKGGLALDEFKSDQALLENQELW